MPRLRWRFVKAERPAVARLERGAAVAALLAAIAAGCATVDTVQFGEKDCAAGGCLQAGASSSSSSSTGGSCTPDPDCAVSYATDIFDTILDGPAGCTGATCHGTGTASGDLTLDTGHAHAAFVAMTAYQLDGDPYIVPCDKDASKLLCNIALADGATNPFGKCGSTMPLTLDGQMKLTPAELDLLAEWIACGAPEN